MLRFDYSKLNGKIVEVFGSQRAFAKEMGWAERTASEKMNSNSKFKQDEIMKSIDLLGLTVSDIPDYFFAIKSQRN